MNSRDLIKTIDALTAEVLDKIALELFDETFELLDLRSERIRELVSLYPTAINKEALSLYLAEMKDKDQSIIVQLSEHKHAMQGTLSNFGHLREYLKF